MKPKYIKRSLLELSVSTAAVAVFLPSKAYAATADYCKSTTTTDALQKCIQTNGITKDLLTIVNALSIGVGVVVIGMIILGGIQYSLAGDNSQATGAAKQRIFNALIALFAYLFIFSFLQWLIPGGLFSK
jgi:hypothetical protein